MMNDWVMASTWEAVLFGPLFATVLAALWAILIAVAIGSLNDAREPPVVHLRTARDMLDEHLTKGEISREAYADRRKALDYGAAIV
jgi:uncharacterized membrane protein